MVKARNENRNGERERKLDDIVHQKSTKDCKISSVSANTSILKMEGIKRNMK